MTMKEKSVMEANRRAQYPMKRQGSNTSSFNRQHRDTRCKIVNGLSEGEANLHHYLHKLGLPSGIHTVIEEMYSAIESRIWILDNSLDMDVKDCTLLLADGDLTTIVKEEGHSRWAEQLQVVDFHMKMAARACIPTKFWMTNEPKDDAQRYGVCWGEPKTWSSERDLASQKILKTIKPERVSNPLGQEICKVIQKLKNAAAWLKEERKFVSVVICTQGVPRNEFGDTSPEVMKECIKSFKALSDLPVKIVFRLCTGDKKVLNFYKKVGIEINCDVLGNYWDEAKEVYQHNSWLTYGIGLHRIREAGLGSDIMNHLDERSLSTSELYDWCRSMFVGDNDLVTLRHPAKDWSGFITDVKEFLSDEQMVWNPITKKLCPWIDVALLESIYQPRRPRQSTSLHQKNSLYARRHSQSEVETTLPRQLGVKKQSVSILRASVSDGELSSMNLKSSSFRDQTSLPSEPSRSSQPKPVSLDFSSSIQIDVARLESICENSFHLKTHSTYARRHTESEVETNVPHQSPFGQCTREDTLSPICVRRHTQSEVKTMSRQQGVKKLPVLRRRVSMSDVELPFKNCNQTSESFHARPRDPEPVSLDSSSFKPRFDTRQISSFYNPFKSSTVIKQELQDSLFAFFYRNPQERSLRAVIKEWSHKPNGKLRPLQMLLFEAPVLLPPNNPLVKHHEYFDKWRAFSRDEFKGGEGGDAADEVVRKLARRCKIFLHPDKWPADLDENQKLLLQILWDTLSESVLF